VGRLSARYDDGRIACDDGGITVRWYYLWGAKHIPYGAIRGLRTRPLTGWRGRWRLWGSADLVHWYHLDLGRPGRRAAIELDLGGRVRPTLTPDDPELVAGIITEHVGPVGGEPRPE
jgi:hypothetical protein